MAVTGHYQPGHQVTRKVGASQVRVNRLVEAQNDGTVREAVAGSVKVLGTPVSTALPGEDVVVQRGFVLSVVYVGAANYGDPLIAAANGEVAVAGATPDARTLVGRCESPLGVSAGAVGDVFIKE